VRRGAGALEWRAQSRAPEGLYHKTVLHFMALITAAGDEIPVGGPLKGAGEGTPPVQEQSEILHRDRHYQTEMRFASHPIAIKGPHTTEIFH
jgi:hypothetical protein